MPTTSPAQHRLMEATAHHPGGYDGVPQNVGKEFVAADAAGLGAAGIMFYDSVNKKILLTKRGPGSDHPGEWAFPGGHIELGETAQQAAIRECEEEIGYSTDGTLFKIADTQDATTPDGKTFTAFFQETSQFTPTLNYENSDWIWCPMDALPAPLHPGVTEILAADLLTRILNRSLNELDVARQIQEGTLASPQKFGNVWLFDIRITGTGTSYRSRGDEFVYRPPEHYMNDNFLARCNGLAVIWQHPVKATLDSKEFEDRVIGSVFLPYLKPEAQEVWGIAKVYDQSAADIMREKQLSTSPTVVFQKRDGNSIIQLDDGTDVLIEGNPSLLDHVAICENGVWDKGGIPSGVLSDYVIKGDSSMNPEEIKAKAGAEAAEEAKKKADAESGDKLDRVLSAVDSISKRMDSYDEKAKADAEAKELENTDPKKVAADKAKADAEEEEKKKADAAAAAKADSDEIKKKIADVEAKLPTAMSDDDFAAMADCQAKADSVASAHGESAPRPLQGETVLGYRKRVANKFKAHSKEYKGIDISSINDAALFGIVESKIYSDSMAAAMNPTVTPGMGLREVKIRDEAGRMVREFKGEISSWTNQFKSAAHKLVKLNKEA